MKKWLKENSFSLVVFALFFIFLFAQSLTGYTHYNDEQSQHDYPSVSYLEYIGSENFIETVFENWESEFLQMGAYILLTIHLRQKGSAESNKLIGKMPVDQEPKCSNSKNHPVVVKERRMGAESLQTFLKPRLYIVVSDVVHAPCIRRRYRDV